ncbi:uncharacterized protein OCT59_013678 [Rhizophagus irregularis]|uniref:Uncharacterized protein n=1 Tax=Rhizophagus irregularis (strain DAOM 181602 / DAOM 197198 / MUCL 43194) TaxID=747089 RepID=A0A2P4QJF8_RHIID|nr:hypothetical protein GLOIN_2v1767361 [Rhizophagus irregularis DAOM 181602=DAOM 197198]POG77787.1 hypothetical protein GLOIN_2v1767361 [Rhizophagus irregularis DAOM 181602=DAOM 197198]UZO21280.1 hypothetical protein OCT59_013678 [Rhizophagus irregularis]GET55539.1 hypothetical protein GLOIN_2v1767361 [Rhizophagus irregularis DAOM 181602=DAOM 197198]|eukprot:XP_025184653.1 hypothetical protein GLOIN_2v1767361 [Rhizophagus irregularis DAOM 181602=DAOM 197198]
MEGCTIINNSYLVGPGIRIAVYIQSILGFIKIFTKEHKATSANLGALTSFCLVVAALASHANYVLLLEVSQFVTLLTLAPLMFPLIPFSLDSSKVIHVLYLIVYLMGACYNMWLWIVLKWRLPKEECGDKVKFFFFTAPVDPADTFRILAIEGHFIALVYLFIFLFLLSCSKMSSWLKYADNASQFLNLIQFKGNEGIISKNRYRIFIFYSIVAFPIAVLTIASTELSVQKSPISEIWRWGVVQILAMVFAMIDLLITFIYVIKN